MHLKSFYPTWKESAGHMNPPEEGTPSNIDWHHANVGTGIAQPAELASFASEAAPIKSLSPRERTVLILICRGLSNKRIARQLNITPETVKSHAKKILVKLQAKTRAEAVARAAGNGILR